MKIGYKAACYGEGTQQRSGKPGGGTMWAQAKWVNAAQSADGHTSAL